jgi:hypothetical protein
MGEAGSKYIPRRQQQQQQPEKKKMQSLQNIDEKVHKKRAEGAEKKEKFLSIHSIISCSSRWGCHC